MDHRKSKRVPEKHLFLLIKQKDFDYAKVFDSVNHNKLKKILQEIVIPGHLTCLLRNLFPGQGAAVRTTHGTIVWFQIGKGVGQDWVLSPYLFNIYTEYIMKNAGQDEGQAGIQISGRNVNNLRLADDSSLRKKVKKN